MFTMIMKLVSLTGSAIAIAFSALTGPQAVPESTANDATPSASFPSSSASSSGAVLTPEPASKTTDPSDERESQSLVYPGSNVILEQETQMSLTSEDSPDVISDWYKQKIKALGNNAVSDVRTRVNGVATYFLTGEGGESIRVTIEREVNSPMSRVKVEF